MAKITLELVRPHVVRIDWAKQAEAKDIRVAFHALAHHVERATQPLTVIIVFEKNPRFPMSLTVLEALPLYQNERLGAWLVVGGNSLAKAIEATLYHMTRRDIVHWFDTEDEAMAYLNHAKQAEQGS